MFVNKQNYLVWQEKLFASNYYRKWWRFWSNYSLILLVPVGIYFWLNKDLWSTLSFAVAAFVVARFLFIPIMNMFYKQPRPYQLYGFDPLTSVAFSWATDKPTSFPSRHIISFAAVAGALLVPLPIISSYILIVGIITGMGRVIAGFHYPRDIIGAVAFGLIIGLGLFLLFT